MTEYSPQEQAALIWDASLEALHTYQHEQANTKEKNIFARPSIAGLEITTKPEEATEPDEISLHASYDGAWHDTIRTLTLTAAGVKAFRYQNIHWGDGDPENDPNNVDETLAPDAQSTLHWLAQVSSRILRELTGDK